jgi:hypothetical protein
MEHCTKLLHAKGKDWVGQFPNWNAVFFYTKETKLTKGDGWKTETDGFLLVVCKR